ncbi:cilia- and flagella-associated protein 157-like [Chaetodon auriga]|uniref:cilia- and flagella-associated protein 157-like n=1 Tax=Chaetodon auriga TaxID=39042 RepID=UPI004032A69A
MAVSTPPSRIAQSTLIGQSTQAEAEKDRYITMVDIISSEETETSFYSKQIRYLHEELERCLLNCVKLGKENKILAAQYRALETDKKDITEYLQHILFEEETKVEELMEQVESEQQALKRGREALKQQTQQLQQLQEHVDELSSVNMMQAAKSEEQKEQLMQQQSDIESLKKQLVSQEMEHEAAIHRLFMELDKKMQSMLEDCVNAKTSIIVKEERAEHMELLEKLPLKESMDLDQEKEVLRERVQDLYITTNNLENRLNKISQKSLTCEKEVKLLKERCLQLEVKLKDCGIIHGRMLAMEENLSQDLASVYEERCQITAEVSQLGAELQREMSRSRQLEGVMFKAVITLRHILTDSEKASNNQEKMQRLLEILESTVLQETVSTLDVSTERANTLNTASDPLFLLVRFIPADLGLVPPRRWEKQTSRLTCTRLPPVRNKKLCRQTTSTSADLSPQHTDSEPATFTSTNC